MNRKILLLLSCSALCLGSARPAAGQEMDFEEYEPTSGLKVPEHPVTKARYPFIDVHNHQRAGMDQAALGKLVKDMDDLNMHTMVNLSGGSGEQLKAGVANLKGNYPGRFVLFANLDLSKIDAPGFGQAAAAQLAQDVKNGAQGLKIFKNLGLTAKDNSGKRIATDDPRLDPIWAKCAELRIPVLIHTGEPRQFFDPQDKHNERWLELKQFPSRARPATAFPGWEEVMAEQHRLFRKHPKTIFINAHLGWMGGDLARLGKLMDEMPNMYTEIGAVLAELGRQPRYARQWFIKYQDRVMFGKDSWAPAEYHTYFRVLETQDEYFDYYRKRHAFWKMYGLGLPDEVLKKLYYKNALKIIPGIDARAFPK
jgi:predicted TIM-barrel fold metal-dependent hydrolase